MNSAYDKRTSGGELIWPIRKAPSILQGQEESEGWQQIGIASRRYSASDNLWEIV